MPNEMSLAEGFICLSFRLLYSGPQWEGRAEATAYIYYRNVYPSPERFNMLLGVMVVAALSAAKGMAKLQKT